MHQLNNSDDLDDLIDAIGARQIVMLGEASHGTHEYYSWRTAISKWLIKEKGFRFIAVEGDWPDCYKINRFIKGFTDFGTSVQEVLLQFDRWPTWMWANWEVAALADWLAKENYGRTSENKIGFYGLDVYSLWDSMHTILDYLENEDPTMAESVRSAITCFQPFEDREHLYARHSLSSYSCRDKVLAVLTNLKRGTLTARDPEDIFNAEQNALVAVNAEAYYRSMIGFDNESWNVRDTHMMETLDRLVNFHGKNTKAIVWEHNTHIGDARATTMKDEGMINIGQLAREQYGINKVFLVGFASYTGSVIAGSSWGAPMQEMAVPPAKKGSIEAMLHEQRFENGYLIFENAQPDIYSGRFDHRAIGVVYDPARESWGNYVPSDLAARYDALVYIDRTTALHPLHMAHHGSKMPDTYPFGL